MFSFLFANLFSTVIVFIVALFILIKAADYFTDAAEDIGLAFKIPRFIVGVTIVSVGTSLPELATSFFSVFRGVNEFVVGNVVGSNIANILLVIGVAAIVGKKLKIEFDLASIDLPLLLGSAFLLGGLVYFSPTVNVDGVDIKYFTMIPGIFCLAGYGVYFLYTLSTHGEESAKEHPFNWKSPVILIVSSVFVFLGAQFTIDSVINGAQFIPGVDAAIVALSAVALGTSLPELMISIHAVRKQNYELAVGNALGSNIFNTFIVMGMPALVSDLVIPMSVVMLALPVMIGVTLLFIVSIMDKEFTKYEGSMFILFYLFFIWKLFTFSGGTL